MSVGIICGTSVVQLDRALCRGFFGTIDRALKDLSEPATLKLSGVVTKVALDALFATCSVFMKALLDAPAVAPRKFAYMRAAEYLDCIFIEFLESLTSMRKRTGEKKPTHRAPIAAIIEHAPEFARSIVAERGDIAAGDATIMAAVEYDRPELLVAQHFTPLHVGAAASLGRLECMQLMCTGGDYAAAFLEACRKKHDACAEFLAGVLTELPQVISITTPATVRIAIKHARRMSPDVPHFIAIEHRDMKLHHELLAAGHAPHDCDLAEALKRRASDSVQFMLDHGAYIGAQTVRAALVLGDRRIIALAEPSVLQDIPHIAPLDADFAMFLLERGMPRQSISLAAIQRDDLELFLATRDVTEKYLVRVIIHGGPRCLEFLIKESGTKGIRSDEARLMKGKPALVPFIPIEYLCGFVSGLTPAQISAMLGASRLSLFDVRNILVSEECHGDLDWYLAVAECCKRHGLPLCALPDSDHIPGDLMRRFIALASHGLDVRLHDNSVCDIALMREFLAAGGTVL